MRSYNCLKRAGHPDRRRSDLQVRGGAERDPELRQKVDRRGHRNACTRAASTCARTSGGLDSPSPCATRRPKTSSAARRAHRKSLLMNLSKEIIEHERIKTTEAKAKAVKPEIEKLITLAKRGDLHARRQALSTLAQDKFAVHKLFEEVAPRYAERPGRLHAHPEARPAAQRLDRDGLHRARLSRVGGAPPRRRGRGDGHQADDRVRRDRLRRLGAPARRAHRAGGARARAAHGARRARPRRRAAEADGRRAHRSRRARVGAGRELRPRGGRSAAPERAARRRRRGARGRAGAGDGSTRAATRRAGPTATACSRGARAACSSAGARSGGRGELDRDALAQCAAALRGAARLHGVHAERDRALALSAATCSRAEWRARRRRCSSSGSRRTCSCAT